MINPYFVYFISFVGVQIVYLFGWSDVYPNISLSLILFNIITFIITLILGVKHYKKNKNKFYITEHSNKRLLPLIFLFVGYFAEYMYTDGMPLTNPKIVYAEYTGIPTLHVILFTFTIFYSTYLFYLFISNKNKWVFISFLSTLLPAILLISRGMLMNIFLGCFFVYAQYVISKKKLSKTVIVGIVSVVLVFLYMFGLFGNYRSNPRTRNVFNTNYVLRIGEATEDFRNSHIPKELFWSYIYISSPLANLQKNINEYEYEINAENLRKFVTVEIIPDFISKRISSTYYEDISKKVKLIKRELVVGTMYMGAYYYIGWVGIIGLFLYMLLIITVYMKIVKNSKEFYVVGIAMLCNIIVLNTFSNILAFSGMVFQLAYPVMFIVIQKCIKKYRTLYQGG
ncbi:O-antigen polymerase [Clostridium intestinale]|uniref:Oligosaccharide repeat unit polymerase n=1 Tax=Clostridium intestinale DSM 6191 TaxID=1121320 RepID=A0A1M6DN85_9CLOT|nr:O-antigen polymerase [Clostridium intestinale]SHI74641.1 hypothetical protein SAMN02745941_04273 [Clostridium intestinale DSM 6191]